MTLPSAVYPLKGFVFFIRHPKELWLKTLLPFLLTLGFGVASIIVSFFYFLPWQTKALENAHWPSLLSWIVAVVLSILECAILDILCFAILLPFFQDALFDATLKARGLDRMLNNGPEVPGLVRCCRSLSSSLLLIFFTVLARVLILIITLPLNLIPVVGTVLTCYINGFPACWGLTIHHDLELKGLKVKESLRGAWHQKVSYTNYGAVQVALELIPIANLLFMWTNIVGVALWLGDVFEQAEQTITVETDEHTHLLEQNKYDQEEVQQLSYGTSSV